jgi:Tol biopolymer transport system component
MRIHMQSMAIRRGLAGFALLALFMLARPASAVPPADGWLVWQSNRLDARSEVYRAHADGTEVVRLTKTGGLLPLWAPDGRWIAYHDEANTGYLMRPDGSDVRTLTAGPPGFGCTTTRAWSSCRVATSRSSTRKPKRPVCW